MNFNPDTPEVSQLAKDCAARLIVVRLNACNETVDREDAAKQIQRALDAAAAEASAKVSEGDAAMWMKLNREIARLTKELAEERDARTHSETHWNRALIDADTRGNNLAEQLFAERAAREKAEADRDTLRELFNANPNSLWDQVDNLRQKLEQTERDREEALAALRRRDTAILTIEEDRCALRRNLAQAERERDRAEEGLRGCCLLLGFDISDGEGTSPDEVVAFVRDALNAEKQSVASLTAERNILSRMLAAAEKSYRELKHRTVGWKSYAELESELAGCRERTVSGVGKIIQERDALAQRVAELVAARDKIYSDWGELKITECKTAAKCKALEKELAAVRVCFAEASQSAGPTTVHVEALKAKVAKLEKALLMQRELHKLKCNCYYCRAANEALNR